MKHLFSVLILFFIAHSGVAAQDSLPPYLKVPFIPPFRVMALPDSAVFTKADLKEEKKTVIIYFNPDCDHCIHEMEMISDNKSLFKKTQVLMVSYQPYLKIREFYLKYKVAELPFITMARDPAYFIPVFYDVRHTPFTAVYNTKGRLSKAFEGTVRLEWLQQALQ